jgi:hypothetical protein
VLAFKFVQPAAPVAVKEKKFVYVFGDETLSGVRATPMRVSGWPSAVVEKSDSWKSEFGQPFA